MCWVGFNIKDIACRKAETNIVVYKVVLDATKDSCMSAFENYLYNTISKNCGGCDEYAEAEDRYPYGNGSNW